jgi:hypothetical protein
VLQNAAAELRQWVACLAKYHATHCTAVPVEREVAVERASDGVANKGIPSRWGDGPYGELSGTKP